MTYTIPADGDENIPIDTKEIEVGLSEPITESSIIFTLTKLRLAIK